MGIPQEILVLIQKMYVRNEAQVKIWNCISGGFRTKGLKQGCGLSLALFTIYLESLLYNWNNKCRSMGLPLGNQTIRHLFADDQVL